MSPPVQAARVYTHHRHLLLLLSPKAATHLPFQAESTWLAGYIPRWFTRPQTVTHPGTNRVWCSAATLIEANALPLSQTANGILLYTVTDWCLIPHTQSLAHSSVQLQMFCNLHTLSSAEIEFSAHFTVVYRPVARKMLVIVTTPALRVRGYYPSKNLCAKSRNFVPTCTVRQCVTGSVLLNAVKNIW